MPIRYPKPMFSIILGVVVARVTALDLDAFMSYPFTETIIGHYTERLERLAFVRTDSGIPNIFVVDAGVNATQRTTYSTDASSTISLSKLAFSGDGAQLFYTESRIGNCNPTHDVQGSFPSRLFVVDSTGTGKPRVLLTGVSTWVVTPGGKFITYSVGSTVSEINIATGAITQLFKVSVGTVGDLSWTPENDILAFTNNRKDHTFLGLFKRNSSVVEYPAPSVDKDTTPVWSHGKTPGFGSAVPSRKLAFLRLTDEALNDEGYFGLPNIPLSLMVLDLDSRVVKEIYRDTEIGMPRDTGYGNRALQWSIDDSSLIIPAENSGWLHPRRVYVDGRAPPADLVKVDCEVLDWVIGLDNALYITHNCDNLNSRGIARLDLSAASPTPDILVKGDDYTVAGMAKGNGMVIFPSGLVYLESTWNHAQEIKYFSGKSPSTAWQSTIQRLDAASKLNSKFNNTEFVKPKVVSFQSTDGEFMIYSQVFRPTVKSPLPSGKYPGVVFTHGGPTRQMFAAFHFSSPYAQTYAQNQFLASQGYVVISVNYRAGVGYGRKFRLCKGCGLQGAAEYADVLGGQKWLAADSSVDPSRIGVYGLSYGGINALQCMTRDPTSFAAGVANAPVFNWVSMERGVKDWRFAYNPDFSSTAIRVGPPADLAGPDWTPTVDANIKLAWESSPASQMANLARPVLVIHGDMDDEVPFQETTGFVRLARRLGKDHLVTSIVYPDDYHGLAQYSHQKEAMQSTYDFFVRYLTK